jgi:hypothetical protein
VLLADEIMFSLECEPAQLADPEVRAAMGDFARQLEAAGISPRHLLHFRSGTIMASLPSLGPYVVPAAAILVPAVAVVLAAWLKTPHRRVRIKTGDTVIEATSVEDVQRLIPHIKKLQEKQAQKKPKA